MERIKGIGSKTGIQAGEARPKDRLLRASEVADILGISIRKVWSLRADGTLPCVSIGAATRFRVSDVQRVVAQGAPQ